MIPAFIADQALRRIKAERHGQCVAPCFAAKPKSLARGAKTSIPKRVLRCEPISTAIGLSALIFNAAAGAVSIGVASAIGGAIVGSVAFAGLSFASSALGQKGTGPITADIQASSSNTAEQRLSTRQSAPPKRIPYGEVFQGGALFFEKCKPPYLYRGYLLSARKINGIKAIFIGNNRLSFSSLDPGQILTPLAIDGQPAYSSYVQVSIRHGEPSQTIDPLLARDFVDLDSNFRQRGIATVVVRYQLTNNSDLNTSLWGASGNANTFFLVDGVSVYDSRDPTQLRDDETSWKFSRNATLCQADYARASYGGRVNANEIDWDKISESADYDDEAIICKDGTAIARHTIDGMLTLNQKPYDVFKSMLTANRASLAEGGDKIWLSSAKPRTPALCIYDDLFMDSIQFRNEKLKRDQINILQTRFIANDRDYTLADGPILRRADYIATDGEELVGTLDLPWTTDYRRVERLQKAFLESSRLGRAMTSTIDLRAMAEAETEIVAEPATISSDLFPSANFTASINSIAFVNDFSSLQLTMSEVDYDLEKNWNASEDEVPFTLASLDLS